MSTFNIFQSPTKCDIKVGYISTDRGYVAGIGLYQANVIAKRNPGTTFIFATRERIKYLNINQVNKLTPNDLLSDITECKGITFDNPSDEGKTRILFSGGGGVGAKANPVIGKDGGLIAVDLVSGGFGYQYPPIVTILDEAGIADGVVATAGIATTATVYQTYEDEEDFEVYDLKTCAPPNVGYGTVYGPNGKKTEWTPHLYINKQERPFDETVKDYIDLIREVKNPWWHTRLEPPNKVTSDGKTSKVYYKVDDSTYKWKKKGQPGPWGKFMNTYAISPKPPSNAKGSDFAGKWFTFEWDVDFPFDGEYRFFTARDNRSRLFIDNESMDFQTFTGTKLDTGKVGPTKGHGNRHNMTKGTHNIRLELFNIPITENVNVQEDGSGPAETREFQVAGAGFYKKSNGYYMRVGGNVDTEVSLKLTYDDSTRIAGTAITKIVIPNPTGKNLVLERKKRSDGKYEEKGSVSAKAIFARSEDGYGPIQLYGNEGRSKLTDRRVNYYGPNTDRHGSIEFFDKHGDDINAKLHTIGSVNLSEDRVRVKKLKPTENQQLQTVFNTTDYINKANRKLWRTSVYNKGGFLNDHGVCPFDTYKTLEGNPYAGTHRIVWNNVNFPVTGNYIIEIAVDDNVNLKIGDQVSIRKEGFYKKDVGGTQVSGRGYTYGTGPTKYVKSIKAGRYTITADLEQIPGGKFGFATEKDMNPMALAIDIRTVFSTEERIVPKSWNENPMGVSLLIEAPSPPIPQQPIPKAEGRCPNNPFWTTRFPGAKHQWHPVLHPKWGKFMNKYAMSPVPPYDHKNTSGGGIWFDNEWDVDVPYDGFYKLRAGADNEAKFWVDDKLVLNLSNEAIKRTPGVTQSRNWFGGFGTKVKAEAQFFLSKGQTTIKVEVHNHKYEETKLIDQKIFDTSDWLVATGAVPKTQNVTFKIRSGSMMANSIAIKELNISASKPFTPVEIRGTPQGQKGQINQTYEREVVVGKVYDVEFGSTRAGETVVGKRPIQFSGMESKNLRRKSNTRLEFDDNPDNGFDVNASFTIDSGKGKFSEDGKKLEGSGPIKLTLSWDDDPDESGRALQSITIRGITWSVTQRERGSVTRTVELGRLRSETKNTIKLRNSGESVVQMEDFTDNDWTDIVIGASTGKFFNLRGDKCKFMLEPRHIKEFSTAGTLAGGTVRDGVTYEGPRLASYRNSDLGRLFSPFHIDPREVFDKTWTLKWKDVNFPETGEYTMRLLADDTLTVRIDGKQVGFARVFQNIRTYTFNVNKGKHTIDMDLMNIPAPASHTFKLNPVVGGVVITRKVRVGTGILKAWSINPMGISGKLIPPPCPKTIEGTGIVYPVTIDDPGNGHKPPGGPGYPVRIDLTGVKVKTGGSNYNCAEDQIVITPNEGGAKLSLCDCGPYGRINKVCVDSPGKGITEWPTIRVISPTGINAELIPILEVVRDPIAPPERLLQVTDLVGVKQTGYYDGRAYYGAVFYKEGVRYAGYYETAGELVQIYDTLQESIDAMVTTPPSAILRQGTDISSSDPRLDIPGTPENLT